MATAATTSTHPKVIYEGALYVQGWFSTWRSRYCLLCINRTLHVYNNKEQITNSSKPKHILNLSTVITIKHTISDPNQQTKPNKKKKKFMFEMTTVSQNILLSLDNEDIISQWINHLNVYVFGNILHCGYMTKQGFKVKSWKKRYFTLSSWKEVRYYENNTLTKSAFKGKVDLCQLRVLRNYVNFKTNQFIIELLTEKRTYIFVNEFHDEHIDWVNKLENVLKLRKTCSYCDKTHRDKLNIFDENNLNLIYYKMSSLHEGILHSWNGIDENETDAGGKWEKNYYAIDGRTMRLFYTKSILKMESFQNALIEKDFYEQYIGEQLDGYYLLFGAKIDMIEGSLEENADESEGYMAGFVPGMETMGAYGEPGEEDMTTGNDGTDIEDGKDDEKEAVFDKYDKFKFKFVIGDCVFGVNNSMEAKLWVNGLRNSVNFSMREVYNYDDEKHYLCKLHLSFLICRVYSGGLKDDDGEIMTLPYGAFRFLVKAVGSRCWDNDNLLTF